jgi:hypothetical protein
MEAQGNRYSIAWKCGVAWGISLKATAQLYTHNFLLNPHYTYFEFFKRRSHINLIRNKYQATRGQFDALSCSNLIVNLLIH